MEDSSNVNNVPNKHLDITREKCPMTFVKTRLLLETMAAGEVAEILLNQGEAVDNVPQSVSALGHEITSLEPAGQEGVFRLMVRVL